MDLEIGKWLLDIAKYLVTAMLLASVFRDMNNPWVVVCVMVCAALTFWLGVIRIKKHEQKNKVVKNIKKR